VSNSSCINEHFVSIDFLPSLFIQNNTTLEDVRTQLVDKLIELGHLPMGATRHHIRLRDKTGTNPGRILSGSKSFADNSIFLYDNKVILFQILDEPEELPSYESGDTTVFVQKWIRSTWSLGEKYEVLLRGSMSVADIAQGLSIMMDVPINSIRTMVVPRDTEFPLYELNQKSPPTNFGRSWFDPTKEKRLLRVVSHDLRVRDGDLLLIQDENETLKELSKADLKSIEIGKAMMTQYSDFWGGENGNDYSNIGSLYNTNTDNSYSGYTDDSATKDNSVTTTTHVPSFTAVKSIRPIVTTTTRSTGIHIKTQRERQEEEDARLKGVATSDTLITSSYNINNNRDGNNNTNDSSNSIDAIGINDMVPEECSRDGTGYSLFGDIY